MQIDRTVVRGAIATASSHDPLQYARGIDNYADEDWIKTAMGEMT